MIYKYRTKEGEFTIRVPRPLTKKEIKTLEQDISSTDNIYGEPKKEDENATMDRSFSNPSGCLC